MTLSLASSRDVFLESETGRRGSVREDAATFHGFGQPGDVVAQNVMIDVVLAHQRFDTLRDIEAILKQPPKVAAHTVEAEILARAGVEKDDLVIEFPEHDVVGDLHVFEYRRPPAPWTHPVGIWVSGSHGDKLLTRSRS